MPTPNTRAPGVTGAHRGNVISATEAAFRSSAPAPCDPTAGAHSAKGARTSRAVPAASSTCAQKHSPSALRTLASFIASSARGDPLGVEHLSRRAHARAEDGADQLVAPDAQLLGVKLEAVVVPGLQLVDGL